MLFMSFINKTMERRGLETSIRQTEADIRLLHIFADQGKVDQKKLGALSKKLSGLNRELNYFEMGEEEKD